MGTPNHWVGPLTGALTACGWVSEDMDDRKQISLKPDGMSLSRANGWPNDGSLNGSAVLLYCTLVYPPRRRISCASQRAEMRSTQSTSSDRYAALLRKPAHPARSTA